MAVAHSKKTHTKYRPVTVGSFSKDYSVDLKANERMHLSTYIEHNGLPNLGKLLRTIEKNLSK